MRENSGGACAHCGCGGHPVTSQATFTPAGYQGPAQHTYTPACAGFHPPGPCPDTSPAAQAQWSRDYIRAACGPEQGDDA